MASSTSSSFTATSSTAPSVSDLFEVIEDAELFSRLEQQHNQRKRSRDEFMNWQKGTSKRQTWQEAMAMKAARTEPMTESKECPLITDSSLTMTTTSSITTSATATTPATMSVVAPSSTAMDVDEKILDHEQLYIGRKMATGLYSMYVSGKAGVGKSLITRYALSLMKQNSNLKYVMTATTGRAASLVNGMTLAKWTGFPKELKDYTGPKLMVWMMKPERADARERWRTTHIVLVDEASMLGVHMFNMMDYVGRRLRKNLRVPIGGLRLILIGDMFQIKPVKDDYLFTDFNLFKSVIGFNNVYELMRVYRQTDVAFINALEDVRTKTQARDLLPETVAFFNACVGRVLDCSDGIQPTRIYALNKDVNDMNMTQLAKLPGTCQVYQACDSGLKPHLFEKGTKTEMELKLKVGAQVMLIKNVNVEHGLVNSLKGVVIGFVNSFDWSSVTTKDSGSSSSSSSSTSSSSSSSSSISSKYSLATRRTITGQTLFNIQTSTHPTAVELRKIHPTGNWPIVRFQNGIETIVDPFEFTIEERQKIVATRRQLGLKLAWAISAHGAQGETCERVEASIDESVWELGQAYNILSRAKSAAGLTLKQFNPHRIKCSEAVLAFKKVCDKYREAIPVPSTSSSSSSSSSSTSSSLSSSSSTPSAVLSLSS